MEPFGVKVLCIEPGFFKTNVTDAAIISKSAKSLWERLPQDVKDDYGHEYLQKSESQSSVFFKNQCIYNIHNLSVFYYDMLLNFISPS